MSYRSPTRARDLRRQRQGSNSQVDLRKYHRPGVSQDEIAELKEAFDLFDVEKKGSVETAELKHSMSSLSYDRKNKMVFQILDKIEAPPYDTKESITFEEFLDLMTTRITDKDSKEEINKVFQLFDTEGKGHITVDDLKNICRELGEEMSDEELKEMIDRADLDGKGYVNSDEFYNIMTKKTFS